MREESEVSRAEMVMIISLFRDEVFINKIKKESSERRELLHNTKHYHLLAEDFIGGDEIRCD